MSKPKRNTKILNHKEITKGNNKIFYNYDTEETTQKKKTFNKSIKPRLLELRKMTHINQDVYALNVNNFSQSLKQFIQKVEKIPSNEYKEKTKMEYINSKKRFKYYARVVLLIIKSLFTRRKYFQDSWLKSIDHDPNLYLLENDKIRSCSILQAQQTKSTLTRESLMALSTPVEFRNESNLKTIVNFLNRFNVFEMIIPKDSMIELAKRIKYQKLENARIICNEGQIAKNIFFVISGKINCVRKFDLKDGELFKIVNVLNKTQYTDPEEVEKKFKRNYLMYSKGVTEVLILNSQDLEVLRYNNYHLPVNFLSSLNLFNSYPIENLTRSSENLSYKYFGPNEIISNDSENSPWIYVIISGFVKVVKKMKLINTNRPKTAKFISNNDDTESYHELNSPLSVYQDDVENGLDGLNRFQVSDDLKTPTKEFKYDREFTLPYITSTERTFNRQSNVYLSASLRRETPHQSSFIEDFLDGEIPFVKSEYQIIKNKTNDREQIAEKSAQKHIRVKSVRPVNTNKNQSLITPRSILNFRLSYIVVDRIQKGDVFGLYPLIGDEKTKIENMAKKFPKPNLTQSAENRKNVILISEGAEVVLMSKVSFYQYADVQTLCKIEQLEKADNKYISENEAREKFYKLEKWQEYKKKLFKSVVNLYN